MNGERKDKVLIVDDRPETLGKIESLLQKNYFVITAKSLSEGIKYLSQRPDIVLVDIRLNETDPSNKEGLELLRNVKSQMPDIPVIMITAYGDVDIAVEAMKIGASDFVQKQNLEKVDLKKTIARLLEHSHLKRKISDLEEDLTRLEPWEMVGISQPMLEIKNLVDLVAQDGEVTVLIQGETGTGKELVARAIHKRGKRKNGPFIPVAISSLTPSLIESELFGHERGAFTGADKRKIGYIERAHKGVLFLDEIGDLSKEAQIKLLRFLDNKNFSLVGATEEISVDLQLVTATNRDLEKAIEEGSFREDLYYRLKNFQIILPPLRERSKDISLLADHFLRRLKEQGRTRITEISEPALRYLKQYPWPGNVRELKSCIEMAVIYAAGNQHKKIMPEDLPLNIRTFSGKTFEKSGTIPSLQDGINVKQELARAELLYIEKALEKTQGRKTEVWKFLRYNDRFALRRRVKLLLNNYPHLTEGFPLIKKMFVEKQKGSKSKTIFTEAKE